MYGCARDFVRAELDINGVLGVWPDELRQVGIARFRLDAILQVARIDRHDRLRLAFDVVGRFRHGRRRPARACVLSQGNLLDLTSIVMLIRSSAHPPGSPSFRSPHPNSAHLVGDGVDHKPITRIDRRAMRQRYRPRRDRVLLAGDRLAVRRPPGWPQPARHAVATVPQVITRSPMALALVVGVRIVHVSSANVASASARNCASSPRSGRCSFEILPHVLRRHHNRLQEY